MNDYWFIITEWNDDQGRRKRRAEHWADSTRFSSEDLVGAPDAVKAKVLSQIYTLDLPAGSVTERVQHLIATDKERLMRAVLLDIVPFTPGDDRWVSRDVARTRDEPAESQRALVAAEYGVSVYQLATPIDLPEETHPSLNT